jgi:acid phosphatase family membrane protein YuiD
MKHSTREVLKTIIQFVAGAAAAVPVFLATSGIPGDVGAGATALAVAAAVTKFMNLALDEIDN